MTREDTEYREDIIRMAIEAEIIYNEEGWCKWTEDTDLLPFIERFASLVAADAIAEEREACAKVCESLWRIDGQFTADEFAAEIRARGNT